MSAPPRSFAIVANGFADGPAQAVRDRLLARGADVVAVFHPLTGEDGTRHLVETYARGELRDRRSIRFPLRAPTSYVVDPLIPLRLPLVDVWIGFNPLACARGLVARRLRRARVVVLWSVDFVPDRFGKGAVLTRVYDRLDRTSCVRADARVELSVAGRDARNRRHKLPTARQAPTHVVPMGAWLERTPKTAAAGPPARHVVLLSHLVRRQGADVLVDALSVLAERGAPVTADVVGFGPERTALEDRARARGLDGLVRFRGYVPDHRDVERILASASVAVAPYRPGEETFTAYADPGKLKAYLAAGLPILVTDVPPNARELEREAGAEVVPFGAEAFADAIERLLESPETWRERRAAALAYAERFDWPTLLDPLLDELGAPPSEEPRSAASARRRR